MTKFQRKQIDMIEIYIANNMMDTASRSISALIRSASNCKQSDELRSYAIRKQLDKMPEFIA